MPSNYGVQFLGSFNGILLLDIGSKLCLWNPSIRRYQNLSQPDRPDARLMYVLYYDSVSEDFKVVRAIRPRGNVPCIAHLFSSKLSSWKRWTGGFSYEICENRSGTVLNGAPHCDCLF